MAPPPPTDTPTIQNTPTTPTEDNTHTTPTDIPSIMIVKLTASLKVPELKEELKKRVLSKTGNKPVVFERLVNTLRNSIPFVNDNAVGGVAPVHLHHPTLLIYLAVDGFRIPTSS